MKSKRASTGVSKEFEYFVHAPLTRYEGKYIALSGDKVVSSGITAKEVWEKALKKHPGSLPTIAKIPKQEVLVKPSRVPRH